MPKQKEMKSAASDNLEDIAELIRTPVRVGRHLAVWLVFQSTGVSLVGADPN